MGGLLANPKFVEEVPNDVELVAQLVLTIVYSVLVESLLVPWLLFHTRMFYRLNQANLMVIKKRMPRLTLTICYVTLFKVVVFLPIKLIRMTRLLPVSFRLVLQAFSIVIFPVFSIVMFCLLILKFWLVFFSLKWSQQTSNLEWKILLTSQGIESNFFLRNKNKLGSFRYLYPRMIVFFCVVLTFYYLCFVVFFATGQKYTLVLVVPGFGYPIFTLVFLLVLFCKMPKSNDSLFIKKEVKWLMIAFCYDFFSKLLQRLLQNADIWSYRTELIGNGRDLIGSCWIHLTVTAMIFWQIKKIRLLQANYNAAVLNNDKNEYSITSASGLSTAQSSGSSSETESSKSKTETRKKASREFSAHLSSLSKIFGSVASASKSSTSNSTDSITEKLCALFANNVLLGLFMQYLISEFSSELLLALIELTQFQNSVLKWAPKYQNLNPNPNLNMDDNAVNVELQEVGVKHEDMKERDSTTEDRKQSETRYHYQNQDQNQNQDRNGNTRELELSSLQLAILNNEDIPDSYIVHNAALFKQKCLELEIEELDSESGIAKFKLSAYLLYQKYITDKSEFQINISYVRKMELENLLSDPQRWMTHYNINRFDLFHLYTECIEELYVLLPQVYYRFIESEEYMKYQTVNPV